MRGRGFMRWAELTWPVGGSLTQMWQVGRPALRRSQLPLHGSVLFASHIIQGIHLYPVSQSIQAAMTKIL